ncbi:hypothetical protein ACJX0J_020359, partial [Zea mays]
MQYIMEESPDSQEIAPNIVDFYNKLQDDCIDMALMQSYDFFCEILTKMGEDINLEREREREREGFHFLLFVKDEEIVNWMRKMTTSFAQLITYGILTIVDSTHADSEKNLHQYGNSIGRDIDIDGEGFGYYFFFMFFCACNFYLSGMHKYSKLWNYLFKIYVNLLF